MNTAWKFRSLGAHDRVALAQLWQWLQFAINEIDAMVAILAMVNEGNGAIVAMVAMGGDSTQGGCSFCSAEHVLRTSEARLTSLMDHKVKENVQNETYGSSEPESVTGIACDVSVSGCFRSATRLLRLIITRNIHKDVKRSATDSARSQTIGPTRQSARRQSPNEAKHQEQSP